MKRRTFLKRSLTALAIAGAGTGSLFIPGESGFSAMAEAKGFTTSLPVPPLLENLDKTGKSASFNMNVQNGEKEFFPGKSTATLGYNGNFLGPTIKVRKGETIDPSEATNTRRFIMETMSMGGGMMGQFEVVT